MHDHPFKLEPVSFAELPGWEEDDHLAAFDAFLATAPALRTARDGSREGPEAHLPLIPLDHLSAAEALPHPRTRALARAFFETHFLPHRIAHDPATAPGLLTGYYEPVVDGSRHPTDRFHVPLYRRPPDLVNLVPESARASVGTSLTHARRLARGLEPYPTRAEIEAGALARRGLELVYLADWVEAYFLHVQGSGAIRLAEGGQIRVTYDGKNGYPYTSIGRHLVEIGAIPAAEVSMPSIAAWLRADPVRARRIMNLNRSFVFFRELSPSESSGPVGVHSIPLVAGRSLAVDAGLHAIGTPIYVLASTLTHPCQTMHRAGFRRLMVAHDVGSAIHGPERGDVYFGSGAEAMDIAGRVRHPCSFFVLKPRPSPGQLCAAEP